MSTDTSPAITYISESGTYLVKPGASHLHLSVAKSLDLRFQLSLPGSRLLLTGLAVADSGESTTSITVEHLAPDTHAEVLVKTLGTGSSKSSFSGLLSIAPNMPGCSSFLTHKSLLFDTATSKSWPALEISNNQVKCSHAVTSRTITDTDLFYLRSRGLTPEDSRRLLVEAFTADVTF